MRNKLTRLSDGIKLPVKSTSPVHILTVFSFLLNIGNVDVVSLDVLPLCCIKIEKAHDLHHFHLLLRFGYFNCNV